MAQLGKDAVATAAAAAFVQGLPKPFPILNMLPPLNGFHPLLPFMPSNGLLTGLPGLGNLSPMGLQALLGAVPVLLGTQSFGQQQQNLLLVNAIVLNHLIASGQADPDKLVRSPMQQLCGVLQVGQLLKTLNLLDPDTINAANLGTDASTIATKAKS